MASAASLIKYVGAGNEIRFAKDFAIVGLTAGVATAGAEYGMRRTSLSYAQRGAVSAVVGMGTGALLAPVAPRIALGLAVAGLVSGLKGAITEAELRGYIGPRANTQNLNAANPAPAQTSAQTPAVQTNPGTGVRPAGALSYAPQPLQLPPRRAVANAR